jgi:hypothetical protein
VGGVESREPLSLPGRPILSDLADDVALGKRVSNVTRSVTDSSGTTHSYGNFNGSSVIGKAMGAFRFHTARARDAGRIALVPRGVLMEPTKSGDRQVTADPELLLLVSRWRGRGGFMADVMTVCARERVIGGHKSLGHL